jgi:hypothetical protein
MMTETQPIKRKILLKRQARKVILEEIHSLEFKLALMKIKDGIEKQMGKGFDLALSRKLD